MKLLRYLNREVLTHTVAVSSILLVIIISGRFVKYLAEAAVGDLATNILLPVMLYRMPGFLELIIPLGLFIGILMSYGRLYVESEMVVLRQVQRLKLSDTNSQAIREPQEGVGLGDLLACRWV